MISELRRKSLRLYFNILKAQRQTFFGDELLLKAARTFTREQFLKPVNEAKLHEAETTLEMLRHNIVQAERLPNHSASGAYYRLKLRPEIEINDGHLPMDKIKRCC